MLNLQNRCMRCTHWPRSAKAPKTQGLGQPTLPRADQEVGVSSPRRPPTPHCSVQDQLASKQRTLLWGVSLVLFGFRSPSCWAHDMVQGMSGLRFVSKEQIQSNISLSMSYYMGITSGIQSRKKRASVRSQVSWWEGNGSRVTNLKRRDCSVGFRIKKGSNISMP